MKENELRRQCALHTINRFDISRCLLYLLLLLLSLYAVVFSFPICQFFSTVIKPSSKVEILFSNVDIEAMPSLKPALNF